MGVGRGQEHGDDPAWDAVEANALYDLLERAVIPEFYTRDERGIPTAWVRRMRESMARLTPRFSADRTVREYIEQRYLPAAATYRERAANGVQQAGVSSIGSRVSTSTGPTLRFGEVRVESRGDQHLFQVQVLQRPRTRGGASRALRRRPRGGAPLPCGRR